MVAITKTLTALNGDTFPYDVTFKYTKDSVLLNIESDTFKLKLKSKTKEYYFDSVENTTNLFVLNENELHWNLNNTNGIVDFVNESYQYFLKRETVNGKFTELYGTLIVDKKVV